MDDSAKAAKAATTSTMISIGTGSLLIAFLCWLIPPALTTVQMFALYGVVHIGWGVLTLAMPSGLWAD